MEFLVIVVVVVIFVVVVVDSAFVPYTCIMITHYI